MRKDPEDMENSFSVMDIYAATKLVKETNGSRPRTILVSIDSRHSDRRKYRYFSLVPIKDHVWQHSSRCTDMYGWALQNESMET